MRWLLVAMPADYFVRPAPLPWELRASGDALEPAGRQESAGSRSARGGLVMLVAPGPGILTILAAIVFARFPRQAGAGTAVPGAAGRFAHDQPHPRSGRTGRRWKCRSTS